MEYDNTNRGSIWKNLKRETDKHPHLTGTINVEGAEYWVSAWARDKDANPKAPELTFSIKLKDVQSTPAEPFKAKVEDDDMPW
jgi:hypothetical protein|tara:strand:- start:273 stop:521 length:249 start_codon:yes stop_codon:yes gene_type:complete